MTKELQRHAASLAALRALMAANKAKKPVRKPFLMGYPVGVAR